MRARSAIGFAFLLGLAACGGGSEEEKLVCTTMACRDGVLVNLENPPNEGFRVEASAPGETTRMQTCETPQCPSFHFGFTPQTVSIKVILLASGAIWGSADTALTYEHIFPNGPKCGGDCFQASVTVRAGP